MVKFHHPDLRWPILWLRSTLLVVGHNLGVAEIETKKTGDAYGDTTLWLCQTLLLKMTIEIVDLPIENGDLP